MAVAVAVLAVQTGGHGLPPIPPTETASFVSVLFARMQTLVWSEDACEAQLRPTWLRAAWSEVDRR